MKQRYVHGYSAKESSRLFDQAVTLTELLHDGTYYPKGAKLLEAGCGVGAQTIILSQNSSGAKITSIELSPESLKKAEALAKKSKLKNVVFQQADIYNLPFKKASFDHIFVCFVLEHLKDPVAALSSLKKVLKPTGSITVIEGDHGSAYYHPRSSAAQKTIDCLIKIQSKLGGDALIGRRLYPLLKKAEFKNVRVIPRVVYADSSLPGIVDGFTKKTFIAMVKGAKEQAIKLGLITKSDWQRGLRALSKTAGKNGTFSYTFFKAIACK
jgi:ubiquinone/menaquinone biosynthesis C-methylase UbiE